MAFYWPAEMPFNVSWVPIQSEEHPLGLGQLTPSIDSQRSYTPFRQGKGLKRFFPLFNCQNARNKTSKGQKRSFWGHVGLD